MDNSQNSQNSQNIRAIPSEHSYQSQQTQNLRNAQNSLDLTPTPCPLSQPDRNMDRSSYIQWRYEQESKQQQMILDMSRPRK